MCECFQRLLPESCQSSIQSHDQFRLFALGTYLLLLGKCCRGWGMERQVGMARDRPTGTARERIVGSSTRRRIAESASRTIADSAPRYDYSKQVFADPLHQQFGLSGGTTRVQPIAVGEGHSPKMRGDRRGARLDVGSFLIGVEVSLRDSEPSITEGVFGPLTNGKRVHYTYH